MNRAIFGDELERELLSKAKYWLTAKGYCFERIPIGPVLHNGGKGHSRNPLKGFPDLAGFLQKRKGVLWTCELKTAKGSLSPEQIDWAKRLKAQGVGFILARSLEDLIMGLDYLESL